MVKQQALSLLGIIAVCGGLAWVNPAAGIICAGAVAFVWNELRLAKKQRDN